MCKYPNASFNTLKKVDVYSIQVIQTTMTLIKYSSKDKKLFKAVECCSSIVPTSFEDRLYMFSVYDLMAFLYADLLEQVEGFKALKSDQLGDIEVAEENIVCYASTQESDDYIILHRQS